MDSLSFGDNGFSIHDKTMTLYPGLRIESVGRRAVCQSTMMLDVPASSLAGQLPQGIGAVRRFCVWHNHFAGAAAGCNLLILLLKIQRSQPRCTRQLLQSIESDTNFAAGIKPVGASTLAMLVNDDVG
jgi:hypothetical protein